MSIFTKVKEFILGKDEDEGKAVSIPVDKTEETTVHILDVSPNVYLACRAAKLCIGKYEVKGTIYDRMKYIEKIVGMGHESILEHTNVVAMVVYNSPIYHPEKFSEIIANAKFLDMIPKKDGNKTILLIGGSIRGFMHLIRETDKENIYLEDIRQIMYQSVEKCFLRSLITEGLLDESECNYMAVASVDKYVEDDQEPLPELLLDPTEVSNKTADLIFRTNFSKLMNNVYIITDRYTKREIVRFCHFTMLFHDISRSCGNQLCRHRNGITQESQRYVTHEYTKEHDFIDPIRMQLDDRYKDFDKKLLEKFNTVDFKTYKDMISAGIYKEDARAWLPMNVTTKIMMTFNGFTLAKFLQLRLAKGAQLEIRNLANEIVKQLFISNEACADFINTTLTLGYRDLKPEYVEKDIDDELSKEEIGDLKIDEAKAEEMIKLAEEYNNNNLEKH